MCAGRCVAVCCSVLQCVAVCCSVLQCGTVHPYYETSDGALCAPAGVLQCVAVRCSVFQCVAVWYSSPLL